ncbi:CvpA family protein [Streptococcus cuniculipharyngis]|uniref:CvpA family protein n=1 Tax=Streptococcus cuniculipharyngis TaxID=1562651 RepID=A0A5C5SE05_9STRE|nr:CvpA family protein [Streptococcus cuniculipharyngis]TWS98198.1 CvpA family protein [Streptococcus cuniculipharyngis]
MISLILLLVFAWAFYIGYSRGLLLQAYYAMASLLSLGIAGALYRSVSPSLTLWVPYSNPSEDAVVKFFTHVNIFELSQVYYAGVAFFLVYILAYLFFRLLGIFVHLVNLNRFDSRWGGLLAGALSVLVTALGFSMVFTILATVPLTTLQNHLYDSFLVRILVDFLPIFSSIWMG